MARSTSGLISIAVFVASLTICVSAIRARQPDLRGYDLTETGLVPKYPTGYRCSPLTSLHASWIDVDGSKRDERHSGVDLGRLNDQILAPAPAVIRSANQLRVAPQ